MLETMLESRSTRDCWYAEAESQERGGGYKFKGIKYFSFFFPPNSPKILVDFKTVGCIFRIQ